MTITSLAEDIGFLRAHLGSMVKAAVNSDRPPHLVINLNPRTPEKTIEQIVKDIGSLGYIYLHPKPDIGSYSISISPNNHQDGKALLRYCDLNPNVEYIELDGETTAESSLSVKL